MNIKNIKSILHNDTEEFDRELSERLNSALKNHPKVVEAKRITQIYEEIEKLNNRISALLSEAQSIVESDTDFETAEEMGIEKIENVEDVQVKPTILFDKTQNLDKDFVKDVFDIKAIDRSKSEVNDYTNANRKYTNDDKYGNNSTNDNIM